ncbi:hypothetical protein MRX96_045664 [Rhipicephalus microplus]
MANIILINTDERDVVCTCVFRDVRRRRGRRLPGNPSRRVFVKSPVDPRRRGNQHIGWRRHGDLASSGNVTRSARPRAANEEPREAMGEVHRPAKRESRRRHRRGRSSENARDPKGARGERSKIELTDIFITRCRRRGTRKLWKPKRPMDSRGHPPSKDVGTDTRLLATKREPTILGLRKKKASARYKRSQLSRKEWRGASPTHQGASVDPSAPASTAPSGVSSSLKEGSLFEEKGQDFHTAAQDSKQTATESDRVRSSYAGSLLGVWASWRKRLGVAVACVTIVALVAVAGLVALFWPRHRTKEAAVARANRSDSTKQSKGPVKQEIPVVQLIATNVVKILGLLHRLLH